MNIYIPLVLDSCLIWFGHCPGEEDENWLLRFPPPAFDTMVVYLDPFARLRVCIAIWLIRREYPDPSTSL